VNRTKPHSDTLQRIETTDVVFRIFRCVDGPQDRHPEPFALFPGLPGTRDPGTCSSFARLGHHASAYYSGCIRGSRPAKPKEYAALQRELEAYPYRYKLRIIQRATAKHFGLRTAEIARATV